MRTRGLLAAPLLAACLTGLPSPAPAQLDHGAPILREASYDVRDSLAPLPDRHRGVHPDALSPAESDSRVNPIDVPDSTRYVKPGGGITAPPRRARSSSGGSSGHGAASGGGARGSLKTAEVPEVGEGRAVDVEQRRGFGNCPRGTRPVPTDNAFQPYRCERTGRRRGGPISCPRGSKLVPTSNPFQPYKCVKKRRRSRRSCPRGSRLVPTNNPFQPYKCVKGSRVGRG